MRILHVTESMASGVMVSLANLARNQGKDGHAVVVLHSRRPESPDQGTLDRLFPPPVRRIELPHDVRSYWRFPWFMARIAGQIISLRPDVVHLHSSYAGLAGRLVAVLLGVSKTTAYSPHGFAFANTRSRLFRAGVVTVEHCLNRLGGKLVLVSRSEAKEAEQAFNARRSYVLENRLDLERLTPRESHAGCPVIGTVGRISYAKGPWNFAAITSSFAAEAKIVWIGDGDDSDKKCWLGGTDIEITGWKSPEEAARCAAGLDIYVSTALWEGMPLAVMEAQAIGIPCVVSAIGGNVDAIEHGVTGFACSTQADFISALRLLISDKSLRLKMGDAARQRALRKFSDRDLSSDSVRIYCD